MPASALEPRTQTVTLEAVDADVHLEPWSMPPCRGDSEHHPDPDAMKLLQQMLDLGISRYAPDPMAAIEQAKRETVK